MMTGSALRRRISRQISKPSLPGSITSSSSRSGSATGQPMHSLLAIEGNVDLDAVATAVRLQQFGVPTVVVDEEYADHALDGSPRRRVRGAGTVTRYTLKQLDLYGVETTISPLFDAGIAQLVERNLAKVEVASSSLVSRSS